MINISKQRYVRDPIHGIIYLPELAWKIIDTPLFQRSRRIKQLGIVEYVYPGATHSRFSHMIGTAHLASKVCDHLGVSGKNKLVVILAGLLHDIGHSPMSHIYEQAGGSHHEARSELFIDYLCEDVPELSEYSIEVKNIISGKSEKPYMAEIISNSTTGLDFDKIDYILRDCYYTGVKCIINADRIIDGMSLSPNGNIVYNKKIVEDITDVFRTRHDLHKRVYQHKTVRAISLMICEIFKENPYEPKTVEEWITFTDDWFNQLRNSVFSPNTKNLFNDIDNRQIWKTENLTDENKDIKEGSTILDIYTITSGYKGKMPLDNGEFADITKSLQNDLTIYMKVIKK